MRIAIDIDSTLHDHWPLVAAAALRRYGIELPYADQVPSTWLDAIGLRRDGLHGGGDKVADARRLGIGLLVDDSPPTLLRALDAGLLAATLRHPWNAHVCDGRGIVCGADWRTLGRRLAPVLAGLSAPRLRRAPRRSP